jgi:hypothetical protein
MHRTKWYEFQHLQWRCDGCSVQCQTFGTKPKDDEPCDVTINRIQEIVLRKDTERGGA